MKKIHFSSNIFLFCLILTLMLCTNTMSIATPLRQIQRGITLSSQDVYDELSLLSMKDKRLLVTHASLPILDTLEIKEPSVILLATGDIMFHSPQINAAYEPSNNTYDFFSPFSKVMPYIKSADYALSNFETTTSGAEYNYSGYPTFNAPDETLIGISEAGFNYLSTANNHAFDRKLHGVYRTLDQLDLNEFDHNGTFNDTDAPQRFIIKKVKGFKLGILSITYGLNGFEKSFDAETLYRNVNLISPEYDLDFVKNQLALMDEESVDASIVFVHWGNEYQLEPNQEQQDLAQNLVLWGADVVLGSHPHVIQKSEILKFEGEDKYIIYSMGNFISNQSRDTLPSIKNAMYTEDGVMVYITLEKSKDGNTHLKEVKHIPTWVYKYYDTSKSKYLVLPTIEFLSDKRTLNENSDTPIELSENTIERIKASYDRSMSKLTDYTASID